MWDQPLFSLADVSIFSWGLHGTPNIRGLVGLLHEQIPLGESYVLIGYTLISRPTELENVYD